MLNIKKNVIEFLSRKHKTIKYLSIILNIIAGFSLVFWLLKKKLPILGNEVDLEALFVLLTTIALFFNQVYKWLLKYAEYSPAYALALGYVKNFIEPAIIQLVENGIKNPIFYIYKPENISELYIQSIDMTKATIKNKSFEVNELQLNLKHGRARDILTIQKSKTKMIYFDFPNTLLSLSSYIDFKIASRENETSSNEKVELTNILFDKFYAKVDELLKDENLDTYIKYCDKNLLFSF
ncbi:STING domain-containing protein [Tenacibaculum finnmarkense]|uniref:STING domain-containing protein n=1 Tax=Tenacibaculum finnmarkense TaxID=2781243 RepID=UPI000C4B5642|nr:STING domain-containing protein [Tenacibaculum finnmarkense]MCD8438439.1 hypothetical protein [Tenacibaculum finnmarkense genomovar ulcerans]MCG8719374.1 hypothetical protein [Tenacibaculum finnmarkense]SOS53776.1 conserved hypothetical protein [Tenacibaculum finnmarkense]